MNCVYRVSNLVRNGRVDLRHRELFDSCLLDYHFSRLIDELKNDAAFAILRHSVPMTAQVFEFTIE